MKKLLLFIDDKFEELFLVSTLFFSVALIFTQVVMRYVFRDSLSWSEEMARYLFVWQAWIAASFATKRSRHINLDIVVNLCPPKGKEVLFWVAHLTWLAFTLFLTWKSAGLARLVFSRKTISAALQIKMGWVYLAVPVGCALMSFRLLQILAAKLSARAIRAEEAV
ncbi:MAG: TRAP transporter small permease [Synergistaceae bacterium]|jgi:TRAP-type C4-dicarboxylate transport system permease small subunit|nr:TRAP transporter small permease [Synergistaceae bacterium]